MASSSFDLRPYLQRQALRVNLVLDRWLDASDAAPRIVQAMRHSLMAGGKRMRPVLCLAAAEAVGEANETALLTVAAALEMVHTYSLIHDDLPAMDDDDRRRGQPTCHVRFDEATAILAGDALLTLAFEILSAPDTENGVDPRRWLQVIAELASAAGHRGMIEGQMRDMAAEKRQLTLPELEALHRLKTGAMIRAAVRTGAILADADAARLETLDRYARCIGLAFQVTDDILDVEGDPQLLGKAVGSDQRHHKSTYPSLLGLDESKRRAAGLVDNALQALDKFDNRAMPLRALARYILNRRR